MLDRRVRESHIFNVDFKLSSELAMKYTARHNLLARLNSAADTPSPLSPDSLGVRLRCASFPSTFQAYRSASINVRSKLISIAFPISANFIFSFEISHANTERCVKQSHRIGSLISYELIITTIFFFFFIGMG